MYLANYDHEAQHDLSKFNSNLKGLKYLMAALNGREYLKSFS